MILLNGQSIMAYGSPDYDFLMDAYKCEICNQYFKGLGYHIYRAHKITVEEYKKMFGFDRLKTFLSEDLRQIRKEHVFRTGMYKNLKYGKPYRFKKGEKSERRYYKRSPETKRRLQNIRVGVTKKVIRKRRVKFLRDKLNKQKSNYV